ncbi:MAG TPA: rod shape-determining protein RodA [Stellaceae bacterium]|nr:rod shape-determining protein RodA [Stellaceae bacterium]
MSSLAPEFGRRTRSLAEKLRGIPWGVVLLLTLTASFGVAMLYSAADGHLHPWAVRQIERFAIAFIALIAAAMIDLRQWFRLAYWVYAAALLLVVGVDLRGFAGMGAQRWIDLGILQLQPSELMSFGLILALARYFHGLPDEEAPRLGRLFVPVLGILVPAVLVLKEPDLGTAAMLLMAGAALLSLAGVRLRLFVAAGLAAGLALPAAWHFLHGYQKQRIYTFLHPGTDARGAGYHILQSKIALGSGGLFGKGFLLGTQSHLNFLPEKATDFIFTMLAEEFGFVGGLTLLALYILIVSYGFAIALRSRNHFGRLLGLGIVTNFFLYVFINMAMVMGLIPVVGVPLPLVSYGGSAMLTVMLGFGLLSSISINRDLRINRHGESQRG